MSVALEFSPAPVGEAALVARAAAGDAVAVRALIQRHNRRLYRLARSIVRNDAEAEDVLQEAYLRAFTRLAQFRGEAQFSTWLSRIVLNEALARAASAARARRTVVSDAEAPATGGDRGRLIQFPDRGAIDPERSVAQREIQTLLERAVDALPDAFRTVMVARAIEGMSVEETAVLLGIRPETVKTRLHRARTMVKATLEAEVGPVLANAFPFDGARCERIADRVVAALGLA